MEKLNRKQRRQLELGKRCQTLNGSELSDGPGSNQDDGVKWAKISAGATCLYTLLTFVLLICTFWGNTISRTSLELGNRAYVGARVRLERAELGSASAPPGSIKMTPDRSDQLKLNTTFGVQIMVRNEGSTPARDVRLKAVVGLSKSIPSGEFLPVLSGKNLVTRWTDPPSDFGKSEDRPYNLTLFLSPQELSAVQTGGQILVAAFQVIYEDVFAKEHSTLTCSLYSPAADEFIGCPRGQKID